MWTTPRQTLPAPPPTEKSCPLAQFTPPTGYEPKLLDDYSETTEIIFQEESGDKDVVPSYLCDAELDDVTIGKALSSPLFIQEREEPADRRQAYHSYEKKVFCQLSPFLCVAQESRLRKCLADFRPEIQKRQFQADSDRRSIQELNGIIESQRKRN